MVKVAPDPRVTPETVMVCPDTESVPAVAVEKPLADPVVLGALHPDGTPTDTAPLVMSPPVAVYVKVTVFPVELADTFVVGVVRVPVPSAASTVIDGDEARLVGVPPFVDCSCACHVCPPVVDGAVAPDPPDDLLP